MKADATKRGLSLDASVALSWCFLDEKSSASDLALDLVSQGSEAFVPSIWPYEVANALAVAERKKRISQPDAALFLEQLQSLNVVVEEGSRSRIFSAVLPIAREYHLSVYDASYLELALRRGLTLATLDHDLKKAAKALKIPLFS